MNKNVATYIISGFLGSGKTTLIKNLYQHKAPNEKWLIVVNEFGVIGFDGHDIEAQKDEVVQIPGGCMCCSSKLPLQVNLTKALRKEDFDRVIIEPTGLGHLSEIKELIKSDFSSVLNLKGVVSTIDAKVLRDARYHDLDLFYDQLSQADLIVANKVDTYQQEDLSNLESYLTSKNITAEIVKTNYGKIDIKPVESEENFFEVISLDQINLDAFNSKLLSCIEN